MDELLPGGVHAPASHPPALHHHGVQQVRPGRPPEEEGEDGSRACGEALVVPAFQPC